VVIYSNIYVYDGYWVIVNSVLNYSCTTTYQACKGLLQSVCRIGIGYLQGSMYIIGKESLQTLLY